MVSGGGRLRPQEDSLNAPIDMVVGTPGRVLQHIEEGNMVYGDIRYVVIIYLYFFVCWCFPPFSSYSELCILSLKVFSMHAC